MANPSRQGRSGRRESSDLRIKRNFGFAQRVAGRFFGTPTLTGAQTDNFDDNSLDAAKWINNYGVMILEQNQRLEITTVLTAGYYALETKNNASLYDSSASVKILNAGNQALSTYEFYPLSISNANYTNKVEWLIAGGTCYMSKRIGGTAGNLGSSFAYAPATHVYFRIRESLGFTIFDTSVNGTVWTERNRIPNVMSFSDVKVLLQLGNYGVELSTTTGLWDDYNITSSGTAYTQSCVEAITLVDVITRTSSRQLIEAVVVVDNIFKTASRPLLEAIIVVDLVSKSTSRTITEAIILVDTVRKTSTRLLTEALVVVDNLSKTSGRTLTEAVILVDTITKTTTRTLTEAITIVDTFAFSRVIARSFIEAITIVDTIRKTVSRRIIESLTIVDTLLSDLITLTIKSIGNWIVYSLLGLNKTVKEERKSHTLSTRKQTHVVLLSQRSFTASATNITTIIRSNKTP